MRHLIIKSVNIQLPLKPKWFEMTKAGVKKEDYRELTPYWAARLLTYDGKKQKQDFWNIMSICFAENAFEYHERIRPANFSINIMTLGYPKSSDTSRILKLEHKGIEIRTGNPEWGAELGKLYFVIKHGNIIDELIDKNKRRVNVKP